GWRAQAIGGKPQARGATGRAALGSDLRTPLRGLADFAALLADFFAGAADFFTTGAAAFFAGRRALAGLPPPLRSCAVRAPMPAIQICCADSTSERDRCSARACNSAPLPAAAADLVRADFFNLATNLSRNRVGHGPDAAPICGPCLEFSHHPAGRRARLAL